MNKWNVELASLRRLGYPHRVRIQAIRAPGGDHAMLRVELPDGTWKRYQTTPVPFDGLDLALSRVLFEVDEKGVYRPRS